MFKKIANFFKKIFNFFKKINEKVKDFLFKNRYGTIMFLVGIIVAFWDLTLKYLLDGKNLPAIKGIFNIYSTHNTGGAWSIFAGSTIILAIVSIIFVALIVFFNYKLKTKNYFYAISMGLLLSGALCNLYDRLALGYVRDFINLEFIKFPVFNIADIAITIGVILLCVYFLFIMPKLEKKKAEITVQTENATNSNVDLKVEENNSVTLQNQETKNINTTPLPDTDKNENKTNKTVKKVKNETLKNTNKNKQKNTGKNHDKKSKKWLIM